MSVQASYEIYAAAKKDWRFLTRVSTSGEAIEEATKLQHMEKYSAIQVLVRNVTDGNENAPPRLLYQFTRPGAPMPDRELLMHTTENTTPIDEAKDIRTADRSRQMLFIAGGAVATILLLALVFTD